MPCVKRLISAMGKACRQMRNCTRTPDHFYLPLGRIGIELAGAVGSLYLHNRKYKVPMDYNLDTPLIAHAHALVGQTVFLCLPQMRISACALVCSPSNLMSGRICNFAKRRLYYPAALGETMVRYCD